MSHPATPAPPGNTDNQETPQVEKPGKGGLWILLALVAGAIFLFSKPQDEEKPIVVQQVVEVNPQPEQIRFEKGQCYPLRVTLAGNWFGYPLGGTVNIFDEGGNKVLTLDPKKSKKPNLNDGIYRICPGEKDTEGVDIFRRRW